MGERSERMFSQRERERKETQAVLPGAVVQPKKYSHCEIFSERASCSPEHLSVVLDKYVCK